MNDTKKQKQSPNKKSNNKMRVPTKNESKISVRPITNLKLSNGSSNWAQLVKATGMNVKKKDPNKMDFKSLMTSPEKPRIKSKSYHRNNGQDRRTPEAINNASKNLNFDNITNGADVSCPNVTLKKTAHNCTASLSNEKVPANNFKFNFDSNHSASNQQEYETKSISSAYAANGKELTKHIAIDCEMVGTGEEGKDSMVARVSLVNSNGDCIYDEYVTPKETVTDYRTAVSGVRPEDLEKGKDLFEVQKDVAKIVKGRVIVGHALKNDFKVLFISHPRKKIRDTSKYRPFKSLSNGKTPSLKKLADLILGMKIQEGEHNSVQDAQAAMHIYFAHKHEWEKSLKEKFRHDRKKVVN